MEKDFNIIMINISYLQLFKQDRQNLSQKNKQQRKLQKIMYFQFQHNEQIFQYPCYNDITIFPRNLQFPYMIISSQSQTSFFSSQNAAEDPVRPTFELCPQYILLTPIDTKSWPNVHKSLRLLLQDYRTERMIEFMEEVYKKRGYQNIRLVKKIRTDYFWSGAMVYLLNCLVKHSNLISGAFNVLWSGVNTIVKVTKFQIFLLLGHLFIGTMPKQLFHQDTCFGRLMTVYNDEDEVSSRQVLQFRLNKLKSIAKYICIFKSRIQKYENMKQQVIIFQRNTLHSYLLNPQNLLNSHAKLSNITPKLGQFSNEQNTQNKTNIYNIKQRRYFDFGKAPTLTNPNDSSYDPARKRKNKSKLKQSELLREISLHELPIPGSYIYNDIQLDLEEKVFWSYPELLVLHFIMAEGIGMGDGVSVHGIQRYADLAALSKHSPYQFKVKFQDSAQVCKVTNIRNNSIIFIPRLPNNPRSPNTIIAQLLPLLPPLMGLFQTLPKNQKVSTGPYPPTATQSKKEVLQWDIKFLIDWIAISLCGIKNFEYYVEHQLYIGDLKILAREIKDYRIRDVVNIIEEFWEFRRKDHGKVQIIEFFKDFVL